MEFIKYKTAVLIKSEVTYLMKFKNSILTIPIFLNHSIEFLEIKLNIKRGDFIYQH